jgi:pyruvate,water dikinase
VPDSPQLGGKGAGLTWLRDRGYPVPPFYVVEPDEAPDAAAYRALGAGPVAVRSSALAEDGAQHSFAGQYVSILGVQGWEAVEAAIAGCRASGRNERVLAYCAMHGLEPSPVAVVVQRMVEGRASGVMFSATPEDPERVLLSAAFGLGEGVVQGSVPCDTFRVGEEIQAEIAHKDAAVRLVDGQPAEVPVAEPDARTLTDAEVRQLADLGRRLALERGHEVDVEWTLEGDKLWILQVRPVTAPIPRGRRLLWDNSNIIESYNGVTTPLTYSFAQHAYTIVYQLFLGVMGVDRATILANSSVFPRMIGLIRGRVYYNLNAWYRVIQLLPGYRWNRAFMEQMMGVAEVASEEDAPTEGRSFRDFGELVRMVGGLAWRARSIDRDVAAFHAHFDRVYSENRGRDLDAMPAQDLVELYEVLESKLLWAWSTPIVNDFLVMIFFGTLKKLCASWVPDAGELHNELVSGEGGLESTAPMHAAIGLAAILRGNVGPHFTLEEARKLPGFAAAWDDYIARYGDRCVNELKLETPSLRQDPTFLVETLRNYLRQAEAPTASSGGEAALRAKAEARAFGAIRGPRRWLFSWVLRRARHRVRDRENLRFLRTRVFGLARDIFRALARHMVAAGAIAAVDDIFYLTMPEVLGWVRGTLPSLALGDTIQARRREFDSYRAGPPPSDRFHTRGAVHAHNPFTRPRAAAPAGGLCGTGCCPGVVEGPVVVLADPHQGARLSGEILAAFRTDPGWVPLYPSISGLLVERGSLLSHSAVVAREMGLPTIIGIAGLTERLATGERVRMDGAAGTVEKLPAP